MPLTASSFLVCDIETTGLDPKTSRIVEIGAVLIEPQAGIRERASWLVNPGIPIPAESSAIHHLVDEDVANEPPLEAVLPKLEALAAPAAALVAHNAIFDFAFLPDFGKPVLCTRRLALHLWPDLSSTTNQFLRYHFKLAVPEAKGLAAHRAEADALVTAKLLAFLLEEADRRWPEITVSDLVAKINQPVLLVTCQIGEHKGRPWEEVPADFCQWILSKGTFDPDVIHTATHYAKPRPVLTAGIQKITNMSGVTFYEAYGLNAPLSGSEKQVSWANEIRNARGQKLSDFVAARAAMVPEALSEESFRTETFEPAVLLTQYLAGKLGAKWWIDSREWSLKVICEELGIQPPIVSTRA